MLKYFFIVIICISTTSSAIIPVPNFNNFGQSSSIVSDSSGLIVGNFDKWKSDFAKLYTSAAQEVFRKTVFLNNLKKINRHNADKTQTYKMGINQFTDLSGDEFKATYLIALKL